MVSAEDKDVIGKQLSEHRNGIGWILGYLHRALVRLFNLRGEVLERQEICTNKDYVARISLILAEAFRHSFHRGKGYCLRVMQMIANGTLDERVDANEVIRHIDESETP